MLKFLIGIIAIVALFSVPTAEAKTVIKTSGNATVFVSSTVASSSSSVITKTCTSTISKKTNGGGTVSVTSTCDCKTEGGVQ